MRERAEEIGASLSVQSEPGQGAQIAVEWISDQGRKTNDEGRRVSEGEEGQMTQDGE